MNNYQYPLLFEAKDLTDKEKEKIRRYFQKRRESGGGDCGKIEKADGSFYRICFTEKEDQERVLQRRFHTIALPCGELQLTVSQTSSPQPPGPADPASTRLSQASTAANTKGLEKIIPIDVFLLNYLRDETKAFSVLEEQLSSLGGTGKLDFAEEAVVVEKVTGGASVGVAEAWETQVDEVIVGLTESYICHHVVEPKMMKLLLQNYSSLTDDIKVYTQQGYAVVVGEADSVKKKIATLERSLPARKELTVVDKQLKLVKEEFTREMQARGVKVKILRGSTVILEGPDEEVRSGAAKLEELIKEIKQKRVQLPTALVVFMTSSGAASKYETRFQQRLRSPVSLEVASDLVFSSLSPDALDEAEAAVRRDLRVATVKMEGAAGLPPDLDRVKGILISAKHKENLLELRVEVSFVKVPGERAIKVRLVGYSENVSKLQEVLHDYQINQVQTQEVLNLPQPEMVDCFDKILGLTGIEQTEVTFQASHLPYPCVLVSGPRRLVQEAQRALISAVSGLKSDTLVLDGPGALRYFRAEGKKTVELVENSCRVVLMAKQETHSADGSARSQRIGSPNPSGVTLGPSTMHRDAVGRTRLEINICNMEDEQVNVLVVPMVNKQLTSTKIGKCLLGKAGSVIKSKFDTAAANCALAPGAVLQVKGPPSLACSEICFIECLPWDGARGQSVQALANGLRKCLELCVQQGLYSVAFPIIGPGIILKYPLRQAVQVLTESINQFGLAASPGSLSAIHIVIKPDDPSSEECYHEIYRHLNLNMNQGGQAIFRSLTSDLDDVTIAVEDGVTLQVVFGDITDETTAAIVNTTDFSNFQNEGVCKDILTIAGPKVEADLKAVRVNRGDVFVTQSGSLPCEVIVHVCGEKNAGVIEQLACRIVQYCESSGLPSVAIPAICAGAGGLDPSVVAGAILRGVKAATSATPLCFLANIRLVLISINVFLAFKREAVQVFSTDVLNQVPLQPHGPEQQPPLSVSADLSIPCATDASQQCTFQILGLRTQDVDKAMTQLKSMYEAQCSTQTLRKAELEVLTQDDASNLKKLVVNLGLHTQEDQCCPGSLVVSGLKDGVSQVMQMINECLRREVRDRGEMDLYSRVAWCILGHNGNWERLPRTANHDLENNDTAQGIVDAQGVRWTVDLQKMEATGARRQTTKMKRLENLPDFPLPLYWDCMAKGEVLKVVALQPSSAEYQIVKRAFKQTAEKTVMKIERLQNVHLRRAYEVQKGRISEKNRQHGGAGEKLLFHGTTRESADSIMKTGFDRRFAGQNATAYGLGSYFAVEARYSANPKFSKPNPDGSQLMFVARVLAGVYTLGKSNMHVPPPRSTQQPSDRYDSVVDAIDNPSMHVVFHDNQAYPDYLVTFK